MIDILTQLDVNNKGLHHSKCSVCGERRAKLYSRKFKSGQVCEECLWTATSVQQKGQFANAETMPAGTHGRAVKLNLCFGCNTHLPIDRMSSCLLLCKTCVEYARNQGDNNGNRFVEKAILRVAAFARGRV